MDGEIHVIYASTAVFAFNQESLLALLQRSRAANAQRGLTGMLLHEGGNFFQVLEGPENIVMELFNKISADPRHNKVVKIIQEPIAKRSFAEWTMAFSEVTREQLNKIDGLNDFFGKGSIFSQLGTGRAKKLVSAFKDGRWRAKIAESRPLVTL